MDLGAMVCSAGKPDCNDCPLRSTCSATAPETLPKKSPRRVTIRLTEHRAWFQRRQKLHLRQSEGPRWRGLWILPELGTTTPSGRWITELTYPITRYSITMKVFPVKEALPGNLRGFSRAELSGLPIPSPHRKAIEKAFRAIAEK
jgi:A/G-specific adenine glycosylase